MEARVGGGGRWRCRLPRPTVRTLHSESESLFPARPRVTLDTLRPGPRPRRFPFSPFLSLASLSSRLHPLAPPAMAPTTATPPGLTEATRNSTAHWQDDLQALFDHAKDRFADVVWELQSDSGKGVDEVWGHKGTLSPLDPPRTTSSLSAPVPLEPFEHRLVSRRPCSDARMRADNPFRSRRPSRRVS